MEQTIWNRFTTDKVASIYEIVGNYFFSGNRRKKLHSPNFTILSNNCWGGHVYRYFGLSYSSPTVGLYFYADEYIKLLRNLDILFSPLRIIDVSESKYAEDLYKKQQLVPIGLLNDSVEIVFLHYKTPKEAYEKWNRRLARVNLDNLFVKFSEQNLCQTRHLLEFAKLPFPRKALFLAKPCQNIANGIVIDRYTKNGEVFDDTTWFYAHMNLIEWLNS